MNGDNGGANDLVYVPKDAHDPAEIPFSQSGSLTRAMQADSVEAFIVNHACLNSQRGAIIKAQFLPDALYQAGKPVSSPVQPDTERSQCHSPARRLQLPPPAEQELRLAAPRQQQQSDAGDPSHLDSADRAQPLQLASGAQPVFNFTPFKQFSTTNAASKLPPPPSVEVHVLIRK